MRLWWYYLVLQLVLTQSHVPSASTVDLLHKNVCNLLVSRQNGIMAQYHRLMLKEAEVR